MNSNVSTRKTVRIISFALAACVILGGTTYSGYHLASRYRTNLEYTYQRALEDLSDYVSNLETTLTKGIYANTSPQQYGISAKLQLEASGAKAALGQLPLSDVELDGLNKFIAQVGDFASYLSGKLSKGETISQEEMASLEALGQYAKTLNLDIKDLQARYDGSGQQIGQPIQMANTLSLDTKQQEEPSVNSGFREMDDGFTDYPSLIYDGPFSDHIMRMKSRMLKDMPDIPEAEAKTAASEFIGATAEQLTATQASAGNLPVYNFSSENFSIAVTRAGGYVDYMLNTRTAGEAKLSYEEASQKAREYLDLHGISDMKESYYVISNNICTINYAYQKEDVVYYSDLIKIGIALDNGDVVSYNATGYLMNHCERELPQNRISVEEARASVSPKLTVEQESIAMIPTSGLNEVLCYAFQCSSENGDNVLVYINVETGLEEQILILLMSDGGILVM